MRKRLCCIYLGPQRGSCISTFGPRCVDPLGLGVRAWRGRRFPTEAVGLHKKIGCLGERSQPAHVPRMTISTDWTYCIDMSCFPVLAAAYLTRVAGSIKQQT